MSDVQKMAVFDDRIIQERPKFGVNKGALSISNSPFNAIAASSSQMSFNVQVPSLNVYLSREMEWTTGCKMAMDVEVGDQATTTGWGAQLLQEPVVQFGKDAALCAFPLQTACSTLQATINDCTSTINTKDVLKEVLRLTNQKKNRLQRTCPTMLDKYQNYDDAVGAVNNPLGSYNDASDYDNVPNGAFYDIVFLNPEDGSELSGDGTYNDKFNTGNNKVRFRKGVPLLSNADNGNRSDKYRIHFKFKATEKLVLSPFIFSEECGDSVGLYGVNNMQLVFNFGNVSRCVRSAPNAGSEKRVIKDVNLDNASKGSVWESPKLNCIFLTPPLDVKLPPKSIVPYYEYPRYISTPGTEVAAGTTATLQSQTITLPQIPDMLLIYARPDEYESHQGDWYLPIDNISLNFDNFSGLLSTMTPEQLYNIAVDNGLEMDWNNWNGQGRVVNNDPENNDAKSSLNTNNVSLNGGFLLLSMGKDVPLQASQAPSVVGNYTLQFNVRVKNTSGTNLTPKLYTIAINSGFFETQAGSSRIIKGVLTESDVIDAPIAQDIVTRGQLNRMVGGSFWGKLSSAVNKAKDVLMNPVVRQGIKHYGKQMGGPIKQAVEVAEKFGYGQEGCGTTGGSRTGGRRGRKADLKNLF